MASYFLDANFLMRCFENDRKMLQNLQCIADQKLHISVLSVHITCYVHKLKLPSLELASFLSYFSVLPLSSDIYGLSMEGPTQDFEDNIQLNTARSNVTDYFITMDNKLLEMKQVDGMPIISPEDIILQNHR